MAKKQMRPDRGKRDDAYIYYLIRGLEEMTRDLASGKQGQYRKPKKWARKYLIKAVEALRTAGIWQVIEGDLTPRTKESKARWAKIQRELPLIRTRLELDKEDFK